MSHYLIMRNCTLQLVLFNSLAVNSDVFTCNLFASLFLNVQCVKSQMVESREISAYKFNVAMDCKGQGTGLPYSPVTVSGLTL